QVHGHQEVEPFLQLASIFTFFSVGSLASPLNRNTSREARPERLPESSPALQIQTSRLRDPVHRKPVQFWVRFRTDTEPIMIQVTIRSHVMHFTIGFDFCFFLSRLAGTAWDQSG